MKGAKIEKRFGELDSFFCLEKCVSVCNRGTARDIISSAFCRSSLYISFWYQSLPFPSEGGDKGSNTS